MAVAILNVAYVALVLATLTRTVFWLRATLIVAAAFFVVYGAMEDIRSMIVWNLVTGGLHLFSVVRDYRRQRSVTLTAVERQIRDEMFAGLNDFDFNVLWSMGRHEERVDEVLITPGSHPDTVSLILSGVIAIEEEGDVLRGVRRGGLIGEMSFVSGEPATVQVSARGEVSMRVWDQRQLTTLEQVHPASGRAFRDLMARDLVNKARS